jgi:hypothetical protein
VDLYAIKRLTSKKMVLVLIWALYSMLIEIRHLRVGKSGRICFRNGSLTLYDTSVHTEGTYVRYIMKSYLLTILRTTSNVSN